MPTPSASAPISLDAPAHEGASTPAAAAVVLTAREMEVLRLLAAGLTNPQIAARLMVSAPTVSTHVSSIFNKLGVNSRSAATRYAIEHQII